MDRGQRTTRQRIAGQLREEPRSLSALAAAVDCSPAVVLDHVDHLARSLETEDETVFVAPPACRACGFDGFDDPANAPSRCPECRSENLTDPTFTIE